MNRVLSVLDRLLGVLAWWFEAVCIAILTLMLVMNGINIATRTFFELSHEAVWPWTMILFVWWVFLAFYPLYRAKKDVSIFVIVRLMNPVVQRAVGTLVHVSIVALAVILLMTAQRLINSQAGIIEIAGVPRYWLSVPVILSLLLIALDAFVDAVRIVFGLARFKAFGEIEVS